MNKATPKPTSGTRFAARRGPGRPRRGAHGMARGAGDRESLLDVAYASLDTPVGGGDRSRHRARPGARDAAQ